MIKDFRFLTYPSGETVKGDFRSLTYPSAKKTAKGPHRHHLRFRKKPRKDSGQMLDVASERNEPHRYHLPTLPCLRTYRVPTYTSQKNNKKPPTTTTSLLYITSETAERSTIASRPPSTSTLRGETTNDERFTCRSCLCYAWEGTTQRKVTITRSTSCLESVAPLQLQPLRPFLKWYMYRARDS